MSLAHVIDIPSTAVASRHDAPLPAANGGLLMALDRIMNDPTVSIERVNAAFDFYQRARDDQAKRDFTAALSACQAEMGPVAKCADNPQTKSKYATFAALDAALRPIYTKHGLALSFGTRESPKPDHMRIVCVLSHTSGHEREYTFDAACDGKGAKGNSVMSAIHAEGSALSYGRRYLEGGIFNIAFEDDDGNGASRLRAPAPQEPADMVPDVPLAQIDADPPISAALVDELTGLIAKIKPKGATPALDVLLAHMEISSLSEIRARHFQTVKGKLVAKIAMQKAAEAAR